MADTIDLSFTDESYSTSNPPSAVTLKSDLSLIEEANNTNAAQVNDHESRLDQSEADIVDVRGGQEGLLINGKIVTSVSSNNLTVAVKTLAGADPSSSDPVYARINNTIRSITTALSVTKNAGTNWCNAGGSVLSTKEVDYFVYLIWNTTPATDRVDIGFARVCHGTSFSDLSGTSTDDNYLAFSGSDTPTSTDQCRVAGRFNAKLSASASFNWSIPATSIVIQYPVFTTRILNTNFLGFITATTTAPTLVNGSFETSYIVTPNKLSYKTSWSFGSSDTQGVGSWIINFPFNSAKQSASIWLAFDSSTGNAFSLVGRSDSGSQIVRLYTGDGGLGVAGQNGPSWAWATGDLLYGSGDIILN